MPAISPRNGKTLADAASLSFADLDAHIDRRLQAVANNVNALLPYLLEMHRRLSAPGRRTDLRKGAPAGLTWTQWVQSKRNMLGRGLRSVQRLLRGKTEMSKNWRPNHYLTTPCREVSINKVHCGDCITLMNKLPARSVGLVVTSPPYNLRNSTGNGMKAPSFGCMWETPKLIDGYDSHHDAMPHDDYVKWQRDCLTAMMRVLRDDGAIFYNHKWRVQDGLLQDRSEIVNGFPVRQIVIWDRGGGLNFNDGYFLPTFEVIYVICKPRFKLSPGANKVGDVWRISQETDNPHPAPFPVELVLRCIQSTTADLVLDPFIGSGTTAIAAEICKRSWIGIDKSKGYCKLANHRIEVARRHQQPLSVAPRNLRDSLSIV